MLLLTLSTAVLVLLVFVVLTAALALISHELREIGGTPTSVLAKLRLGLRAIERETSHLPPQGTLLNQQLSQLATGLKSVDAHLARTIDAAGRQGTR
jgi:hypothetical protein